MHARLREAVRGADVVHQAAHWVHLPAALDLLYIIGTRHGQQSVCAPYGLH
jgi:hypothetical protein